MLQGQSPISAGFAKGDPAWMQARRHETAVGASAGFPILLLRWQLACLLVMSAASSRMPVAALGGSNHVTARWLPLALCRAVGVIKALAGSSGRRRDGMKERTMRRYLAPVLLALATAAWPGMAGAVEFMDQTTGPPVGTDISGFTEVLGPEATEPEHAGNFVGPLPEYMPSLPGTPCPSCSAAVRAQELDGLRPPPPQPPQH
jgi:hypothetical protein